ncbi:MAG: (2Fe-2S)-binding protein [Bacteroidia bacterium]|nr:(2Fe-2S)-binding protein [Bacteroidia bacterium]
MKLTLNNKDFEINVEPNMPLLWVLRDELNMTGTKYGCGVSSCGSCSVLIDGVATKTCTLPISAVAGKSITTIEGISEDGQLSAVQKAWIEHQVPQCGYCQSGMIITAEALLSEIPNPTDEDIDAAITNICRCGTYQRIRSAIHLAAKIKEEDSSLLGRRVETIENTSI